MNSLFGQPLSVLNVGLASFADAIEKRGRAATRLEWVPPAAGERMACDALAALVGDAGIEAANAAVMELGNGSASTFAIAEIDDGVVRTYHVGDSAVLLTGGRGRLFATLEK